MPRAGNGTYTLPANTAAVSGDPISSTKFNTLVQDLESDANVDRPIAAGGTGASTAQAALTNLFSGATPGSADKIAFWDHSALAFGWLGLGTGLTFNGTTLELDADLSTLAGLTVAADNFIAGNSGGTAWEVKTPSQARTSLGLGTAALKNTGTSGDAVPLLNVANTFSELQTFNNGTESARFFNWTGAVAGVVSALFYSHETGGWTISTNRQSAGNERYFSFNANGSMSISGSTVWHAGNDGAASGLDADLLDGVQPSAFGLSLIDDADASAARTTLGLGSAATVNTGTSGATVPLLNATNTFSAAQIFGGYIYADRSDNEWIVLARNAAGTADRGGLWVESGRLSLVNAAFDARLNIDPGVVNVAAGALQAGGNTVWHAGNDGAGSGLDADTLDGDQGSAFAKLASPDFSGTPTIGSAAIVSVSATQTLTNKTLTSPTINGGTIQSRPQASSETTGTLTVASANRTIQATGDITINNSVFSAGDIILIYAGASSRTITQGSGVTMRLGGTATTGSRTLAARGVAVLFFVSASEVVVSGGAVT